MALLQERLSWIVSITLVIAIEATGSMVLGSDVGADSSEESKVSTFDVLPIISYDTDVGLGLGIKLFVLRSLHRDESFDLVLFNSTKGERWYRLVFSIPDFELRQGTEYPLAVDVVIDYDKWIKNSFFGIGNDSRFEDREFYTKEPLEISAVISRGFTSHVVGQIGMKYRAVRNFNFSDESQLILLKPDLNSGRVSYLSLLTALRYDTRDGYVNPTAGLVLLAEGEHAPSVWFSNASFTRLGAWVQSYSCVLGAVLAARIGIQGLIDSDLPVQILLPVGGNNTLRGSPQDRFLGRVAAVGNAEVRFPLYWRFGGVVGFDAGRVWTKFSEVGLSRWATNPVVGLRFYTDTFVVRADVGLGKETTGFYLNFGHLF